MGSPTFSARYTAAMAECGGRCPIEAGVLGRLADHECRHGRLPVDRTPPCGCWPEEGAVVRRADAPSRAAVRQAPRRVNDPQPDITNVTKENQSCVTSPPRP